MTSPENPGTSVDLVGTRACLATEYEDRIELKDLGPVSGHGWVLPNANGARARCGGPALCPECRRDHEVVYGQPYRDDDMTVPLDDPRMMFAEQIRQHNKRAAGLEADLQARSPLLRWGVARFPTSGRMSVQVLVADLNTYRITASVRIDGKLLQLMLPYSAGLLDHSFQPLDYIVGQVAGKVADLLTSRPKGGTAP